ncbi:MAG: HAMP domain-containing sensor histidine kinase [Proteobacteria bacterium]|nr:HAMP domain-containing sensor histidine kinase [Pseudomonadota bacterium]
MKEKIQQANLDKSEFLAFVSHELRNPLGAISSLSEILVENNQKPKLTKQDLKENSEISKLINESSSDCLRLLSDLIDVAKSPKDGFAINKKPDVDICHIINFVIKISYRNAVKSRISIKDKIDPDLPHINCDGQRMKQIMFNLISNAMKYSPANTVITVKALKEDNNIKIIVKDQGFGMTEKEVEKALTHYGTVDNAHSDKVDSFGLGLPLVKHLVELHGAKFEINSQKDVGTEVIITFNLRHFNLRHC